MTPNEFRKLALGFAGALESEHMNHPDFRINGKIFASLAYPDENWGMVKLTPQQQGDFVKQSMEMFRPCKGVWGELGATNVHLESAKKTILKSALKAAVANAISTAKKK